MAIKKETQVATKYPDVDVDAYAADELKRVQKLEKMFIAGKEARKHLMNRWRRNEELVNGKFLKPFNLPKYKTRVEPNVVHSVVETMYSILTDRPPKVDIMPKTESQIVSAYNAQEAVDWVMAEKKAQRALAHMKRDGLIYGNGFLKIVMVNGEIEFVVPDPFTVYVDPLATSLEKAQCVIFATPTYVDDIQQMFGKRVASEGSLDEQRSFVKTPEKYATDKVDLQELESIGPQEDSSKSDYRGGQALLKEAWYYEDGKLMLATWVGTNLLQYEESPYDFIPLVTFQNYTNAHSVWGKGEPEAIESLAVGASIVLSQAIDNLIYHGNPAMVMSKSLAKISGNRPTDKPGQIFYTNGPHERIERMPAGNISSSSLPMAESMLTLVDSVSGVHDVTKGMTPGSVTASRAIQQLNEASQTVIRAKEREIGIDAVIDIYKMVLNILSKNYDKPISIRRFADDGSGYQFKEVQPYELDGDLDFKYVPGSSLPESRAGRRDEAIDLLQLGLLDAESFWRWTQGDITKDILNQISQAKAERQRQLEAEVDTISNSTNEDEVMDSLLRYRELSGAAQQDVPEEERG